MNSTTEKAAALVKQSGVIAYPTEAVYGLGCDPTDTSALLRLFNIKKRPIDKGLILIASNQEQLLPFIETPDEQTAALMDQHWPGPVTLVVKAKDTTSPFLTGGRDTIAVRVSSHPVVQQLCDACDHALVSTSANLSGEDAIRDDAALTALLGDKVDAIVEGELGDADKPTQIIDAQTGDILRA